MTEELTKCLLACKLVELSHCVEENAPLWPTLSHYAHVRWMSQELGDSSNVFQLLINEHAGTHIDAPLHMFSQDSAIQSMADFGARRFMGPCVTMDFSGKKCGETVTKEDVVDWERANESLREGDIVLLYFGWSNKWKLRPDDQAFMENWPGVSVGAAEYFVEKRISMVGVDTLSVDVMTGADAAHKVLLGNGILIIENLNHLDQMPSRGYFLALPLLIKAGSGSPIRAIGLYD